MGSLVCVVLVAMVSLGAAVVGIPGEGVGGGRRPGACIYVGTTDPVKNFFIFQKPSGFHYLHCTNKLPVIH